MQGQSEKKAPWNTAEKAALDRARTIDSITVDSQSPEHSTPMCEKQTKAPDALQESQAPPPRPKPNPKPKATPKATPKAVGRKKELLQKKADDNPVETAAAPSGSAKSGSTTQDSATTAPIQIAKEALPSASKPQDNKSESKETENQEATAEELAEQEAAAKKRKAHAAYMKFWRSVNSAGLNPGHAETILISNSNKLLCMMTKVALARRRSKTSTSASNTARGPVLARHAMVPTNDLGKDQQSVLYEDFYNCAGEWKHSTVYKEVTSTSRDKKQGIRRWLTRDELMTHFKRKEVVDNIILRKETDPVLLELECRAHPETDTLRQYLTLVEDTVSAEEEKTISDLFKLRDSTTMESDSEKEESSESAEKEKKARHAHVIANLK